jgi:2'-5' RNA ligase
MIRAFLAVELGEDLRTHIAQVQRELKQRFGRQTSKDVRISWVQPANLHLTMKFLGDIAEDTIVPMQASIAQAVRGHPSFPIPLERLGAFPSPQQPRVIWVGTSKEWAHGKDGQQLSSLHRMVEHCCQQLGFASDDRSLSAHLTVARVKGCERQVGRALAESGVFDQPLAVGSLLPTAIALMKSELSPGGSVYTKLWEAELRG